MFSFSQYFSGQDLIMSLWVPKKEGNCPKHFVVLRKGHIFSMETLIDDQPWTAPEIERAFQKICQETEKLGSGPGVAALTRDPRDTWAENREYLMKLGNRIKVEKAKMFVLIPLLSSVMLRI